MDLHRHFRFLRLLSSSVTSQALLSAANFSVGIILIRRATELQYGYYVLAFNATILLMSLHHAFFYPPMVNRLAELERAGRVDLVGGLMREQHRALVLLSFCSLSIALSLWWLGVLDRVTGPLIVATIFASLGILHREFFRMVLLAHRRPFDVLRTDVVFAIIVVSGAFGATLTRAPAAAAILTLCAAAVASAVLLGRALRRHEPWDLKGAPGILREIAPLATWSASGAAIHWLFSQGYTYIAALTLSVEAVALIVATRLLLMPVNLLSTGIGTLMLPMASSWLQTLSMWVVWRRLVLFTLGVAVLALVYCALLWLMRDWVFDVVLDKQFPERDQLLMLWSAIFIVMVVRDQLVSLLAARSRFPLLTTLALFSACIALAVSYFAMQRIGIVGAPLGVLVGEVVNVLGIIVGSLLETRRPSAAGLETKTA